MLIMAMQGPQQTAEVLAAFNLDLIATGATAAYLDAFEWLQSRFQIAGSLQFKSCQGLYGMVPSVSDLSGENEPLPRRRLTETVNLVAKRVSHPCSHCQIICSFREEVLSEMEA